MEASKAITAVMGFMTDGGNMASQIFC